eukprot:Gb_25065 [translate_table: standard]
MLAEVTTDSTDISYYVATVYTFLHWWSMTLRRAGEDFRNGESSKMLREILNWIRRVGLVVCKRLMLSEDNMCQNRCDKVLEWLDHDLKRRQRKDREEARRIFSSVEDEYNVFSWRCPMQVLGLKFWEALLEMARSRNKIPLPKAISGPGVALPPEQDTLISPNYQLAIPRKRASQAVEEMEIDEDESNKGDPGNTQSLQEQKMDQEVAQRVSFSLAAKRPR